MDRSINAMVCQDMVEICSDIINYCTGWVGPTSYLLNATYAKLVLGPHFDSENAQDALKIYSISSEQWKFEADYWFRVTLTTLQMGSLRMVSTPELDRSRVQKVEGFGTKWHVYHVHYVYLTAFIVTMSPPLHATKRKSQGASISSKRRKGLLRGTESQPVRVDALQLFYQRLSPRKAIAASQATEATANTTVPLTFESQLRESQPQDTIVATKGSKPATVATAKDNDALEDFDAAFANDFNVIDWLRLPRHMKPLATQKQKKSWVYLHGYCVVLRKQPDRVFFVCRYCHDHKIVDCGGGGLYKTTTSTST
ncbi:hypothetical protein CC86DRAFT_464121 [Ophiobolus disseminans]|uniref:Uncharacterized protein n=1 Tax=Ophiobolus disseminans TaxID=1469910 RepID=A0A6A7ACG7_9PLEO|nr:hypothetical protein CC86DRAFT_464121 [Ophiobolus disseminans]